MVNNKLLCSYTLNLQKGLIKTRIIFMLPFPESYLDFLNYVFLMQTLIISKGNRTNWWT